MAEQLIYEDDEQRIFRDEGGTEGEPGYWTSDRVELKTPVAPTVDDRLAAIEQAITKGADYAAMKAELAKADVAEVETASVKPKG